MIQLVKYVHFFRQQLLQSAVKPFLFLFLFFAVTSCTKIGIGTDKKNTAFKDSLEKKVYSRSLPVDSILNLLDIYAKSENNTGIYITSSELGNRYRAQSDFSRAIEYHQQSLTP